MSDHDTHDSDASLLGCLDGDGGRLDQSSPSTSHEVTTPPKKRSRLRNCLFNKEWLTSKYPDYQAWLAAVSDDVNMARCKVCNTSFSVKFDGIKAVKKHGDSLKHKGSIRSTNMSRVLTNFFPKKDSKDEDKIIAAEIVKTFHSVKHGLSYLSSDCGMYMLCYYVYLTYIV